MALNSTQIVSQSNSENLLNPRVEIDTSPPFGSVKEAVTRFGGSGSWIPLHVLRLAANEAEEIDMETVAKQAEELEKELIIKEQETLEVLRELESAKEVMEGLKVNPPVDKSTSSLTMCPLPIPLPPMIILTELKEAKLNLNKTTNDLASIRASVESLNNKMRTHKAILTDKEETKRVIEESVDVSTTFETRQFRKMEEAAQYEVIKATLEIEQTKMSIKMVEMRLIAAKKMEEAARAMEAVARAENNGEKALVREGITLSYEEYSELTQKARKAEEFSCYRKDDNLSTMEFLKNSIEQKNDVKCSRKTLEEALGPRTDAANARNLETGNPNQNHPKTRNLYPFRNGDGSNTINKESRPVLRSSVSIGDILNRKLILQDNLVVREDVESQTRSDNVSLSQMLREQSGLIFRDPGNADKEGKFDKQFFTQRKKFGFIRVSLPLSKQSKKKHNSQPQPPLNMRFS